MKGITFLINLNLKVLAVFKKEKFPQFLFIDILCKILTAFCKKIYALNPSERFRFDICLIYLVLKV